MNIDDYLRLSDTELSQIAYDKMKQYDAGVLDFTNSSDISDDELTLIIAFDETLRARGMNATIDGWEQFVGFALGELMRRNGI